MTIKICNEIEGLMEFHETLNMYMKFEDPIDKVSNDIRLMKEVIDETSKSSHKKPLKKKLLKEQARVLKDLRALQFQVMRQVQQQFVIEYMAKQLKEINDASNYTAKDRTNTSKDGICDEERS